MNKRIPILLGLCLTIIAVWLLLTPNRYVHQITDRLDNLGYDLQLRLRVFTEHEKPTTPVAIIDIDDKSLNEIGRWPWPRSKMAELNDKLREAGAAVIAYDIFFSEPENNIAKVVMNKLNTNQLLTPTIKEALQKNETLFDEDAVFAKSLLKTQAALALGFLPRKQIQNELPTPLLIMAPELKKELGLIDSKGYISNIPILQRAAKYGGFINIFADTDGIIRHSPLLIEYENGLYPALPLQAVLLFLNKGIELITPYYGDTRKLEGIKIGSAIIPTDANGQVLIPFIGRTYTFPYYSAIDVFHNKLPKDALLGKILFVGTSATGLGDLQATAIQNPFPGVEIQATLVNGLLTNNFSYKPEWTFGANLVMTILFGLISAIGFAYLGPRTLGIIVILFPILLLYVNNLIWKSSGLVLSLLFPLILILMIAFLNIIYGYLFETRRRERLKEMFGQYVPEKHIDEMLRTTSDYGLRGEDREMSVLFADIRNFTTISEGMSAADLVDMLNKFFTPMTEIIFKHRGTIDKYIGDLIMAFWGAPLRDKNHARHALQSAIEMQKKLAALKSTSTTQNWSHIKIGIGINSGLMSVGDMGSRFRRNYTVLGDTVNLASRIESLTKFYGVDIITTEFTMKDQPRFIFRKLDLVRVRGKREGVVLYEVICLASEITPKMTEELQSYNTALQFYAQQEWDAALTIFMQLHEQHPHKKLYTMYVKRIQEFIQYPPGLDWDGIFEHHEK